MPFDGLTLYAVTRELKERLTGSRVERVYQPAALEVILVCRHHQEKYHLLAAATADAARVHLTATDRRNPGKIPFFCSVLRRHLEGCRVSEIVQSGLDRILHLTLTGTDAAGRLVTYRLITEIMGKHSNIILVDAGENKILDAIKRYSHALSRYREVLPGQPYVPPPPTGKKDPRLPSAEEFTADLAAFGPASEVAAAIQRTYEGFSLFSAREVVCRAELPSDITLGECGIYEYRRLYTAFRDLITSVIEGMAVPTLVVAHGIPVDFAPFAPAQPGGEQIQGPLNQLVDRFYTTKAAITTFRTQKQRLMEVVNREIKHLNHKLDEILALLDDPAADRYRLYGELLMANLYRLEAGAQEALLENFYLPTSPLVAIPLDPALTPAQNAQRYFKKYAKARAARAYATQEKERLEAELAYLAGVTTAIEQASELREFEEIAAELAEQGYLPARPPAPKEKRTPPAPLQLSSADGYTILVGKNNRQNEYVTFKLAAPGDIWLHARGVPGAHVILKTGGRDPSPQALAAAAALAAYFSQARGARSVPVDWTRRANVQRPKGARPGFVTYTGEKTLYADPTAALALLRRYGATPAAPNLIE
ncbi:Rqc2 family fibronectin-binding protein [Thermodesulfitimonas sp.]